MKMRIKGNSLRYRLTKTDIILLTKNGCLQEETNFPGQTLFYILQVTENAGLSVSYTNRTVSVSMSAAMATEFAETNRVGFEDKSGPVILLVEKDFVCLDNVEEDQSDNYPNPLAK